MNAAQNNYRLFAGSPEIDVGLNSAPGLLPTDLDGLPRIVDGSGKKTFIIDMGAYEFQPVTALPTSIDFGKQILDSHASRNVTLTNHQTGALSVSTITAGGDFTQTNSCPYLLPAGTSCTITVIFTPVAAGPTTATLTIDDDDINGPRKVALSGVGEASPTPTPSATPTPVPVVINVPGDFPTIQAGIDAANNDDTVEVSPGTYFENIDFKGKLITVTSTNGPEATAIDGRQQRPVVVFHSGEGNGAVLSGFTIINGQATGLPLTNGGGIDIVNSSPTISGNVIMHNGGCSGGGGIFAGFSSAIIMNNVISDNTQMGCSGGFGGGGIELSGQGSTQILSNLIESNFWPGNGGGIELDNSGTPVIENNTIMNNTAGAVSVAGQGGGVFIESDSNPLMLQNLIINNNANQGGGVYMQGAEPSGSILVNNTIAGNSVTLDEGSALYVSGFALDTLMVNNLLIGKATQNAVFCNSVSEAPMFQNNDAFSVDGTAFDGSCAGQVGASEVSSVQPQFVNAPQNNYRLLAKVTGNRCRTELRTRSFTHRSGRLAAVIVDGSGKKTFIIDMGAYEFQPVTALPTSVDFGNEPLGSHSSRNVTLTNHQTKALSVSSITAGGDFSAASSCPSSLPAGASCTLTVTFVPTAPGPRSATLTVNDNDTNGPRTVALTGVGQAPATPTLTPSAIQTPMPA